MPLRRRSAPELEPAGASPAAGDGEPTQATPGPLPASFPPEAYANPYAAGALTSQLIGDGVRGLVALLRRRRERRMLERIAVLPPGWDTAGRHCVRR